MERERSPNNKESYSVMVLISSQEGPQEDLGTSIVWKIQGLSRSSVHSQLRSLTPKLAL